MNAASLSITWNSLSIKESIALLSDTAYAYQQHPAYGMLIDGFGGKTYRAIILRDEEPIAYVQLQSRRFLKWFTLALAMRGPVWLKPDLDDDTKAACYRLIKTSNPIKWPYFMMLMPETNDGISLRMAKLRKVVTPYVTVKMDLAQDEESLLKQLDGKWRNQLRKAQKSPLECVNVGLKQPQYQWLLDHETQQRARVGYQSLSPALVPAYQQYAGKDSVFIMRADLGKETVAGVLCLLHGKMATYHIGWSNDKGKDLNAHNLLLWEAMLKLKSKGITQFDLGGINTEDGAGLSRFKLGMGGNVTDMPGSFM